MGCYNSWAILRCSSCSPLGEKSLWNGTIGHMQALSSADSDIFWWHKSYLSFWQCLEKYLVTIDPNFGTLIPSNFAPWLLHTVYMLQYWYKLFKSGRWKYFPCYVLNRWNLSLHAVSRGDVLDAGSTGDTGGFFLVGGITDKSLFEINCKIKVSSSWMLMIMDPLLTVLCKTWLFWVARWRWQ